MLVDTYLVKVVQLNPNVDSTRSPSYLLKIDPIAIATDGIHEMIAAEELYLDSIFVNMMPNALKTPPAKIPFTKRQPAVVQDIGQL